MRNRILLPMAVAFAIVGMFAGDVGGAIIDTVNWSADNVADGTGTGTLPGPVTVNYFTVVGGIAGTSIFDEWNKQGFNNAGATSGVTNISGGVLGTNSPAGSVQSITFSGAVTNPILLVNFTDPTSTMNFGTQSLTLLDSNRAQLAGGVMSFPGTASSFTDGFAARINGTFGPGSPINITYATTAALDTAAFTIAVPEPGSAMLTLLAAVGLLSTRRRGQRGVVG